VKKSRKRALNNQFIICKFVRDSDSDSPRALANCFVRNPLCYFAPFMRDKFASVMARREKSSLFLSLSLSLSWIYERGRSKRSPGSLDKRVRKLLNYFLTPCVIYRAISTQYARDCPTRDVSLAGKNVSGLIPFYGMGDLPWHGAACTPVMKNVSRAQKILPKF